MARTRTSRRACWTSSTATAPGRPSSVSANVRGLIRKSQAEIARRGHRVENHTQTTPSSLRLLPGLRPAAGDPGRPGVHRPRHRPGSPALPGSGRPAQPVSRLGPLPRRPAPRLLDPPRLRRPGEGPPEDHPPSPRRPHPGDILLLHDGSTGLNRESNGGNPVVLEVLPRLLDELAARKLRSVPVTDALEASG